MRTRYFLFAFSVLLLTACNRQTLVDDERTFDGAWNCYKPEVFDITVNNIEDYYNIDLSVAVDTTVYRYEQMPVMLMLHGPNGELRQFYSTILLKDKGRWRGEMRDGFRVADGRIRSYFSFNTKGIHRLEVSQSTSQYDLEGVHSITLNITRAKVNYDL